MIVHIHRINVQVELPLNKLYYKSHPDHAIVFQFVFFVLKMAVIACCFTDINTRCRPRQTVYTTLVCSANKTRRFACIQQRCPAYTMQTIAVQRLPPRTITCTPPHPTHSSTITEQSLQRCHDNYVTFLLLFCPQKCESAVVQYHDNSFNTSLKIQLHQR